MTDVKLPALDLTWQATTGELAHKPPMTQSIPLIRAAAIAPMRRWLSEIGRDPRPLLEKAHLAWVPDTELLLPVPLRAVIRLLVEIARIEGPDAPLRCVGGQGGFEIGFIGSVALSAKTVREGLQRVALAMPLHCTHEVFIVSNHPGSLLVGDGWAMNLADDEERHLVQQYVAALIDMICSAAGTRQPCLSRVGMVPHPTAGLVHLRPWLGDRVYATERRTLDLEIPEAVANRPFPPNIREATNGRAVSDLSPLRQGQALCDDVGTLVSSMLSRTQISLDSIATAAGMSGRTLRRRLSGEGTSFSEIVDRTRALTALRRLQEETPPALKDLARELGYSDQATLTRAMRRWTGETPRSRAQQNLVSVRRGPFEGDT